MLKQLKPTVIDLLKTMKSSPEISTEELSKQAINSLFQNSNNDRIEENSKRHEDKSKTDKKKKKKNRNIEINM